MLRFWTLYSIIVQYTERKITLYIQKYVDTHIVVDCFWIIDGSENGHSLVLGGF